MAEAPPLLPDARRGHILADANPDSRLDYIVEIKGQVAAPGGTGQPVAVVLRYVPDRLVVQPASVGRYLKIVESLALSSLESNAAMILNDIRNELVPRWIQVSLSFPSTLHPGIHSHAVMLEDRQPSWDNAALLARLKPY